MIGQLLLGCYGATELNVDQFTFQNAFPHFLTVSLTLFSSLFLLQPIGQVASVLVPLYFAIV